VKGLFLSVLLLATRAQAQEDVDAGEVSGEPEPAVHPEGSVHPERSRGGPAAVEADTAAEPPAPDAGTRDFESGLEASLRASQTVVSRFPLDDHGTRQTMYPFETRVRVGPQLRYKRFGLKVELDALSGAVVGTPDSTLVADRVPVPRFTAVELRQLYLEYRWATGAIRLGQQISQFGLGMLSGSGAKDAEAGEFGQSRFGSLAWRALVAGRPFFGWGGAWRAVEPVLAGDIVVRDGTADFYAGDRAFQAIAGVRFNVDPDHILALIAIFRHQRPENESTGARATDVVAIDLSAKWIFFERLKVGVELAGIIGDTTNGRTVDAPVQAVRQFGAYVKGSWRAGKTTVLLDLGYASGDSNPYDDQLNAFRFDRDLHVGLVLFEQVMGYQSARAGLRAADPALTGVAPEGVDLLPSGGSITGAAFLFPRVKQELAPWLDLYGGPLFAFSTAKLTDPYSTRVLGGGIATNFLGRHPGDYLGTELDVGLQGRFHPWSFATLEPTLEAGVLFPGNAFAQSPGGTMDPVWLGRLRLTLRVD
jgi:hypothetical protein